MKVAIVYKSNHTDLISKTVTYLEQFKHVEIIFIKEGWIISGVDSLDLFLEKYSNKKYQIAYTNGTNIKLTTSINEVSCTLHTEVSKGQELNYLDLNFEYNFQKFYDLYMIKEFLCINTISNKQTVPKIGGTEMPILTLLYNYSEYVTRLYEEDD